MSVWFAWIWTSRGKHLHMNGFAQKDSFWHRAKKATRQWPIEVSEQCYNWLPDCSKCCLSLGLSPEGLMFRLSVDLGLKDRLSCEVCSSRLAFNPDDVTDKWIPCVPRWGVPSAVLWGTLLVGFGLCCEDRTKRKMKLIKRIMKLHTLHQTSTSLEGNKQQTVWFHFMGVKGKSCF